MTVIKKCFNKTFLNSSQNLTRAASCRTKFTKSRVPPRVCDGSNVLASFYSINIYPHKLHIVTRVKSTMKQPYWEKKVVKSLGLMKKLLNIKIQYIMFFIIRHMNPPLKVPYGLPAEEDMANTYLNSRGELVVKHLLNPLELKAIES
uniref:Large ribosomal subunit protein uL30m n=1 Tax=Sinocyclocheilus grahami TaxID=75366 RepID=A0A672QFP9_SINGR